MTQEEKELLLKDLCARLVYGVVVNAQYKDVEGWKTEDRKLLGLYTDGQVYVDAVYTNIENIKPYLRPMSSMTEEEKDELLQIIVGTEGKKFFKVDSDGSIINTDPEKQGINFNYHWINFNCINSMHYIDWLISNYFDFRGLIPMGLALEAPKNMYK